MSQLLVVGTVATDDIETPYGQQKDVLGGSATYFAAGASFFTGVRIVGVVGGDFDLARLDFLRKRGVDLAGIEVVPDGKTFRWSGRYHHDLNHRDTLGTWLNVLETFQPKLPQAWRDTPYLFLANIDPKLQRQVLAQMTRPKLVVADTMNFWIESMRDEVAKTLAQVDGLIVNDEEARQLSGIPNLVKGAHAIRAMGPRTLVVKKGEHGALLFADGTTFFAPAYPLEEVRDPTGAGDTFAGGFFGYLAQQDRIDARTMRKAVLYGSALASFCVERFGPERLQELTMREVEERVKAFQDLVLVP
ncbi:MAG TPA: PfkB family carbohydrate kinase [Candidatus Thermoplasmatota archaeon]|nr:PfkB family carbohydrate kinase [Candidatus Thermoplasmatota archaeon]